MQPFKPYIGFTGAIHIAQILDTYRHASHPLHPPENHYRILNRYELFAGILVSDKTMAGLPNSHPDCFPPVDEIPSLLAYYEGLGYIIHFCTANARCGDTLQKLMGICEQPGHNQNCLTGFQINHPNPNLRDLKVALKHLRARREGVEQKSRMILWVGPGILGMRWQEPERIISHIQPYRQAEAITDVLLDWSGGQGQPFDPAKLYDAIGLIRNHFPDLGITLGGGLGPDNTYGQLSDLAQSYRLSADAQSALFHPETERLAPDQASKFITESLYALNPDLYPVRKS